MVKNLDLKPVRPGVLDIGCFELGPAEGVPTILLHGSPTMRMHRKGREQSSCLGAPLHRTVPSRLRCDPLFVSGDAIHSRRRFRLNRV